MSFFIDKNYLPASDTSIIHVDGDPSSTSKNAGKYSDVGLATRSSSLIRFYPNWCTCFDNKTLRPPIKATCHDRMVYFFQCPPSGPLPRIVAFLLILCGSWIILLLLLGKFATGPILALLILEIVGLFSGMGMRLIGFPALLAPLTIGIIIRNVDYLDTNIFKVFGQSFVETSACYEELHFHNSTFNRLNQQALTTCCNNHLLYSTAYWIDPIRQIALTLILTRAGLELSPKQLKKLKGVVPMLAFGPCVMEALTCAALFYAFFQELSPSIWLCLVSGFALSAVSPAVVVPGAMSLKKRGFGVAKGVPTLLIASSSIDDVLAITLYTICLSIGLSQVTNMTGKESSFDGCETPHEHGISIESNWGRVLATIGAIPIGLVHGIVVGCFLHFVPSRESPSRAMQRFVLILILNITTMLAFERSNVFSGAGSIGVLVTSFVASFGWRSQAHWRNSFNKVEHTLGHIWTIFVPILFGTIGKEIRFVPEKNDPYKVTYKLTSTEKYLQETYWNVFAPNCFWRVIGIILMCLLVRSIVSFFIAGYARLNKKERLFVAIAWLPKATVQAALAPIVLSQVLDKSHTVQMICIAKLIVGMAVLSIIISAPIGAIGISLAGPRLLSRMQDENEGDSEFPDGDEVPEPRETLTSLNEAGISILSDYEFPPIDELSSSNDIQRNLPVT